MLGAPSFSALAAKLRSGQAAISAWVAQDVAAGSQFARMAFDCVTFDLQHSLNGIDSIARAVQSVALAGKPVAVRIPVGEFQSASRLLDAGACAVIAPMIESADDAARLARFCKYPPVGERSWGPFAAIAASMLSRSEYLAVANDRVLAFAMVESRRGLDAVGEILDQPGVDGVFVGGADLSLSLSCGSAVDADSATVHEALDRVVAATRSAGKIAGIYCMTAEAAAAARRRGFRFLAVGSDTAFIATGAAHVLTSWGRFEE
ncbi:MAG: HpcH/HpaI aldolase/citrate lyase family protein [Lautropia sp.]